MSIDWDTQLRARAEKQLDGAPPAFVPPYTAQELLHELKVHQIELEMQNNELREAQEIIEKSRDRLQELYDFAPIGYLTLNRDCLIMEANLTSASMLKTERGQLLGKRFEIFVSPEGHDIWRRFFVNSLRQRDKQSMELDLRRNDGTCLEAQLDAICAMGDDLTVRIAFTDISARRQAERELVEAQIITESEQKFQKITESALDGIIMMGADKCISLWNAAAQRIFGYTSGEALGQEMHRLIAPHDALEAFERGYVNFQKTGTGPFIGNKLELTALRKGGEKIPVEVTIAALMINGQWNAIGIFRDITMRRQAEAQIAEQMDELRRFNDALVGREMRNIELKREVNELLHNAGQPSRYLSVENEEQV